MRSQVPMWTIVLTLISVVRDLVARVTRMVSHPAGTSCSGFIRSGAGTRTAAACCTGGTLIVFPARCPGRLLPQAASQGVLAALPALLHLGAAGVRLSPEQWFPGLQQAALRIKQRPLHNQGAVTGQSSGNARMQCRC